MTSKNTNSPLGLVPGFLAMGVVLSVFRRSGFRPAAVLHDEAEALLGVEELNGTCGHDGLLLKTRKGVNAPCKPFAWASYPDSACSWGRPIGGRNCKAGEIGTMGI